jgi:hypothetical protein
VSAAAGLREALLDGPAGADPAGTALVDLLAESGLLAVPEFADWCVYVDDDGYTDIDLTQLSTSAWMAPVELTDAQRRTVSAGVCLIDLAAEVRELPGAMGRRVLAALTAVVADLEAGEATAQAYQAVTATAATATVAATATAGAGAGGVR